MISSVGVVPPVILPLPAQYAAVAQVTTVSSAAADPMAVDVAVQLGIIQTLPDQAPLTLDTVVAPHAAVVRYLPANGVLTEESWPSVVGPFEQDAWVIDALGDKSPLAPLLPAGVPAPVYWVLEGMVPASVEDVLDDWLGGVPGVQPQAEQCYRKTDLDQRADNADDTWKQAMLAGRWSEPVPAETVLGLAASDGTTARLRIWTFGADGTELPAAAILDAFALVDLELLPDHPVVTGCHPLLDDLPVRFFLRFDVWDVELSSPVDAKGATRSLRPTTVRLFETTFGTELTGTTWTTLDDTVGGVLAVPRATVFGAEFRIQADFPATERIRLSRTEDRYLTDQPLHWSTAGWTAQDGVTPGNWSAFGGVLVGTQTQPAVFLVGTKVRVTAGYQQQTLDWFVPSAIARLETRRLAAGHQVNLYQVGTKPADTFITDDDGDVSGVSLAVVPGVAVTIALPRQLNLPAVNGGTATTLVALDNPAGSVFPDGEFHGVDALVPVIGAIGPTQVIIDADLAGGRHTTDAVAFHALKYAKFTHDVTTLLKTDSFDLPVRHEFVIQPGGTAVPNTLAWLATATKPARTETTLGSALGWFLPNVVIHEYAHGIVAWLGSELSNGAQFDPINNAAKTMGHRLTAENGGSGHKAWLITNSGTALDEGLPEFFEMLLGYHDSFLHLPILLWARSVSPPAGQESWPQYAYEVTDPKGNFIQLASDMGRRLEGVFAAALFEYIRDATTFNGFPAVLGDTESGSQSAYTQLADWAATVPASRVGQLQRLFAWLVTDATKFVIGGPPNLWTGVWPLPKTGLPHEPLYPTVYDYLRQLQATDPAGPTAPPTPEESFQRLFDTCLLPWNLEQYDPAEPKPPVLALDWRP